MNKTENNHDKPSRAIWFWCGGSLTFLILLTAIAIPIVQNYRAIKHVKSLGGRVETERNPIFVALPDSWHKWLRSSLGDRIQSIETVKEISWIDSSINDDDLRCLRRFTNLTALDISDMSVGNTGLSHLKGLKNLIRLDISNSQITDVGLSQLKGLTKLERLNVSRTQITDEGLSHLKGLTNLVYFDISKTQVSDKGLNHLKGLTNLTSLVIDQTQITDVGLLHLKELKQLNYLSISFTQVSTAGIAELQTALPDCEIQHRIKYTPASP